MSAVQLNGARMPIPEIGVAPTRSDKNCLLSHNTSHLCRCRWAFMLLIFVVTLAIDGTEASPMPEAKEGDLITYYYNVSNIGNVDLSEVVVTDDKVNPIYISGDVNKDGLLNLHEVWLYKATYNVSKDDLNHDILNTAYATAKDPCGKLVDDQDIAIVKTAYKDGEPIQYGQFCEAQKITGNGIIDASTSMRDRKIALEYYNTMNGDGDIELDQEQAYSEVSDKLKRSIESVNDGKESTLNLYENSRLTYSGNNPLQGEKYLHSESLYGGTGANVREAFSVQDMEKEEVSFFAQTMPYQPHDGLKNFRKGMKEAGRNIKRVDELMKTKEGISNPAYLLGLQVKNTFNGTWGTDASWHKIFYKNIKAHEMFSGNFEVEKQIKFHQYPVKDKREMACNGIDC
ncbi:MAG: DUF7507 domain-containing protein [Methanothrix sp.]